VKAYLDQLNALAEQQQQACADPVRGFLMQALAAGGFHTRDTLRPWPKEIASWDLQDSYTAATAQARHPPGFPLAIKRLRALLPPGSLHQVRRRSRHDRVRYYQLPELTAARAHFQRVTGIELRSAA
jgi:hypothetical protein